MGWSEWEVEFYEKNNGRSPTLEFLNSLPRQDLVFINTAFKRLREHGPDLKRPYVAYLRDHIWELRVRVKRNRYRFLYFFYDGEKFVVTHGIKKKTGKVPNSEIDRAIRYMDDYLATASKG